MTTCPECGALTPCRKCANATCLQPHICHGPTCWVCEEDGLVRVLGSDAAVAVGRFKPDGPDGYRAKSLPTGPLRATRAEAVEDERIHQRFLRRLADPHSAPAFGDGSQPCSHCHEYIEKHELRGQAWICPERSRT